MRALRQSAPCNVSRLSAVTRTLRPIPTGVPAPASVAPLKAQDRLSGMTFLWILPT